jgi:hypothetical protein
VLVLTDPYVTSLRELVQLTLDHPQRDVAQQTDDVQLVLRQSERHRLDVEVIAQQHRDVAAPARVHGQAAATQIRIVDDVVVHERGGVDELHDRRVQDGPISGVPTETCRHEQQRGADTLAAAQTDVAADLRNQGDPRLDVALELAVDRLEVVANRLEDLCEIHGRRLWQHVVHTCRFGHLGRALLNGASTLAEARRTPSRLEGGGTVLDHNILARGVSTR